MTEDGHKQPKLKKKKKSNQSIPFIVNLIFYIDKKGIASNTH